LNDSNITEATGAIGINGAPNTNFRLDVNGSTRIRGSNPGFNLEGQRAGGNIWLFQTVDDDGRFRLFSQDNVNPGTERLTIKLNGSVGIGVTNPTSRLEVSGNVSTSTIKAENASTIVFASGIIGSATGATGTTFGLLGQNVSSAGSGVAGLASATSGTTYGGNFQSDSTSGRGVFGTATASSGATYGVYGKSDSTGGRGVFGSATATTGTNYGVYGRSDSTIGRAVFGWATATSGLNYGGRFESDSTEGRGVFGLASAASGTNYGGRFQSDSTDGRGVYGLATAASGLTHGVHGQSNSSDGIGVFGEATATSQVTYGVYGQSASTFGAGVYGLATDSTGFNNGVLGQSDSTSGRGVVGLSTAASGNTRGVLGESNSTSGYGVYGYATAVSGTTYGVYGRDRDTASGYGVFAEGNLGAHGIKSFRIDHPDDPSNKYLLHYATESPEVLNFYRGTVVLDGAGKAVVELPHYFAKINKTPSYQLTAVGAPMPMLHVAEEIDEAALSAGATAGPGQAAPVCSFRIAGGAPGAKVSWRVEAVRNDRWVQTRAAPVEVEKQGPEKGTYQNPALYGQPAEKGMDYDLARKRPDPTRP